MPTPKLPSSLLSPTFFGFCLLAGVVGLDLAWRATAPAPVSAAVQDSSAVADLEAQVEQLQRALARLERRRPAVPTPPREVATPPSKGSKKAAPMLAPAKETSPDRPDPEAQERADAVRVNRERVEAATHLEREPVDEAWAPAREATLKRALGQDLGSAYLVSAECRSSVCRVELEHPEPDALDMLTLEVMARPELAGRRAFIAQDRDAGSGRLTMYVARIDSPAQAELGSPN